MAGRFNTYIERIEPDFWRELCVEEGELRRYEKGEEFATAGQVARYLGYIKTGTLKYVAFADDGTEHVVGLEFAGEFVADFPFSLYDEKSRVSIVAVTPCEIHCFPTRELRLRMSSDAELKDRVMHSSEALFSTLYDRYIALHCKTPQQRYDDLVSAHSDIFTWFPLKDIASFLCITPTHLSRLRRATVLRP